MRQCHAIGMLSPYMFKPHSTLPVHLSVWQLGVCHWCVLVHTHSLHTHHFPVGGWLAFFQVEKNEMGVLTSTACTWAFSVSCRTSSGACSPVSELSSSSVAAHCPRLTSRLSWVKWTAQSTRDWRCLQQ